MIFVLGCGGESQPPGKIVLVPIGDVPADLLAHLQHELPAIVKRDVTIGAAIARPEAALDVSRQQYRGDALLEELKRHDVAGADRVIGIIDADAYAPGLNFIFGQAMKPGRFGVVALPRLRESFRGRPENAALFRDRVLKETAHELGHTFGFAHCDDRKCVMHFSNSLGDTDFKGNRYCERH
ncbi:MAG TPA: archaemetzincin family Zn-dependent metalloprotease [Thermoanaerobaculia bacterium]|nr:archaemetzincin family Zn-dependent metalloprotease [Thermoanaerobaculia bacterium]